MIVVPFCELLSAIKHLCYFAVFAWHISISSYFTYYMYNKHVFEVLFVAAALAKAAKMAPKIREDFTR